MKSRFPLRLVAAAAIAIAATGAIAAQPLPAGAAYDLGFSPAVGSASALDVVLRAIDGARSSIVVVAYSFTSKPIATVLLAAHRRGVKVAVVADRGQNAKSYSAVWFLANQGVPVRLNDRYEATHDKFMVIDGLHVETGSFNYSSAAANRNAENALVLWNAKPLADRYGTEWARLWQEGVELKPAY
ncbi:MAG: Phosphatidylserine/phosphatidylglycerophosphate/ cardiolipin synthases and related enzymes-like protein precursor [uncultured Paraburkholderia sp.]|nr:MAG: Phosphatidylserine/phosphatidylglycerophosphate/ cardiolipin synthases and related enzymes-like protein precursor [uncultured Paraburkholderia sp.]CAH2929151.1 MAG: Phosphatidylserine/phosphatidylglycerophosphate/ cardiolipin synthases and related enzymes-like protein precursor [uncultured Paraburkholderia sp.]